MFEKEPSTIHKAEVYEADFEEKRGYFNHRKLTESEDPYLLAKQHLGELRESLESGEVVRKGPQNRKLEKEFMLLKSVFRFFFDNWIR